MQKRAHRKRGADFGPRPKAFGIQSTSDHIISHSEESKGWDGSEYAVAVYDRGTKWGGAYPKGAKDAERAIEALQHFAGPTDKIESFWSDGSPELKKAARKLEWRAGTSAPHRPSSNGVIERYIRKVVEVARALLAQAGFHHALWPLSLIHI